ncbi:hypothetical protein [Methylibium sp.]|uniref:hypothetical protein n=1 Tax=Methylibium sp. TaxID=2067992 RepID=UPI003D128839
MRDEGPELLLGEATKALDENRAERESAAGSNAVGLDAQSNDVEHVQVGRFDI